MKTRLMTATLLLCLLPSLMFGQTTNATLGGTVNDNTAAFIPGVTITATNTQTGIVTTVISNESGSYQFASLQPGTYRVSAELSGFQTQVYNDVTLGLGQQVRLNFTLQVGAVAQAVEVTVPADILLATTSASVGSVLPEYKVRDLPLTNRNVLDLVNTSAGVQGGNFAGARIGAVNVTRDGVSVQNGRYQMGVSSVAYTSPDLVEEVRVVVAPADAETGRGSGQVQMITRSGTNQFRGSIFWANRNSALDANNWFNNFRGAEKDFTNRNQYGGRLGGPIVQNKTFFFFLYEGMRTVQRSLVIGEVLTPDARNGIFRYFPGVQSGNALSNAPTVDMNGNAVRPAGATGNLQSFNLFTRDPLRPGFDPTGFIQSAISRMPVANDFTIGDGLNIAGHRWVRRTVGTESFTGDGQSINRNQYNLRIDHQFNVSHKFSFIGSVEDTWADANISTIPNGVAPGESDRGGVYRKPMVYAASLVSTLTPNLLNEFRIGMRKSAMENPAAWDDARPRGQDVLKSLPSFRGHPYIVVTSFFPDVAGWDGASRGSVDPFWMAADTMSWNKGVHAFKGGFEYRIGGTDGYNSDRALPRVNLGPSTFTRRYGIPGSGVPVTGIDATAISGLHANDQTNARMLLSDLSGSVAEIVQRFTLCCDSKNITWNDYTQQWRKYRKFRQSEFSTFFKDDWKLRPSLTLNLGVRWEYYAVPYETQGFTVSPVGGGNTLLRGDFITTEFVGKNSPNPDKQLYRDDWNNFAPAVGLSWSLPWLGRDKTVLRLGYGVSYMGLAAGGGGRFLDEVLGESAGSNHAAVDPSIQYRDLRNVVVPLPSRYPNGVIPVTPYTTRSEQMWGFDPDLRSPYVQNWNVELQRQLAGDLTVEVRYVGSKGTKLIDRIPLNYAKIFENGILDAFKVTAAGGEAPLFDRMLMGLNLGLGPVNGTTVRGSASLRNNTIFRSSIANGAVGQFAALLNVQTVGGVQPGGLLRNGGFPENFIIHSPQFGTLAGGAEYIGNPSNSTYHALQLQVTKRLSNGFTNQTGYTWSRALGENDGGGIGINRHIYRDPNNRALDKTLLSYHRTHSLRSSGAFELPFGPNKPFLANSPGWVSRLVERWQIGAILAVNSGAPLTLNAPIATFTDATVGTPNLVGDFPKSIGDVKKVDNGVIYFEGLGQIRDDAARAGVTTLQSTQGSFSNRAITDAQGNVLLVVPAAGTLGNLGQQWIEGPGSINLDMNLVKRFQIREATEFEIRADAINILNHANFGNPVVNINSTSFGRISSASEGRTFTINARLNF